METIVKSKYMKRSFTQTPVSAWTSCQPVWRASLLAASLASSVSLAEEFPAVLDLSTLDGNNGFVINGIDAGDQTGISVSAAGDVNGDGIDDVIIGANLADPNDNPIAGESYVVFGTDQGFPATLELANLDGSNGFVINGIGAVDNSGFSVSATGDVNGDGIDDVIIGAFGANPNDKTNAGESYVVFGTAQGFPASLDLSTLDGSNGFIINGIDVGDLSGFSVSGAGDINGDGINDVIIGAFEADPNDRLQAGESYVVFGTAQGFPATLELANLDGSNGFAINGIDAGDQTGISVSAAGDINGDGIDDVIIGANFANPNDRFQAGESYVVFGTVQGFPATLELANLDGSNGFAINGIDENDRSGFSVSAAGDVNADGIDDVIIGASLADPNDNSSAGESYVVFGTVQGFTASLDLTTLDGTNGFVINGIDANDFSGISVSAAGDVNGDGINDLIIGALGAAPNGNDAAGESYVVFGTDQGFTASLDLVTLDGTNGFVINGIDVGDFSGSSVSAAGDVNGDSINDLIIGAPLADPNDNETAGESYVIFGRAATQETTLCATLGDDPPPSLLDQDAFAFVGTAGEDITVILDRDPEGSGSGNRATLLLFDQISGVVVFELNAGDLPNTLDLTLPADGDYQIQVDEQPRFFPGQRFRGDYCLTLESSGQAHQSLTATASVE